MNGHPRRLWNNRIAFDSAAESGIKSNVSGNLCVAEQNGPMPCTAKRPLRIENAHVVVDAL